MVMNHKRRDNPVHVYSYSWTKFFLKRMFKRWDTMAVDNEGSKQMKNKSYIFVQRQ